ncbi:hypothetical protein [Candidatus Cyanaurora vandensis]|uniref:hypothetical protein n=1 Tax=Candidatus Cyanaurora vandensis TaxID=2714958 RepID=UPI00257D675A|nr:hypothetical protein [Candidatus Cyanaurora vandensis]
MKRFVAVVTALVLVTSAAPSFGQSAPVNPQEVPSSKGSYKSGGEPPAPATVPRDNLPSGDGQPMNLPTQTPSAETPSASSTTSPTTGSSMMAPAPTATTSTATGVVLNPNPGSQYGALPLWLRPSTNLYEKGARTQSATRFFSGEYNRQAREAVLNSATEQQKNDILTCADVPVQDYC